MMTRKEAWGDWGRGWRSFKVKDIVSEKARRGDEEKAWEAIVR